MHKWICGLCGLCVSSAFERNLALLVREHKNLECPERDTPREKLPLNRADQRFLEELKIHW